MRFVRQFSATILWGAIVTLILSGTTVSAADSSETAEAPSSDKTEYILRFKFEPGQKVSYNVVYEMAHTSRKGQTTETAFNKSTTAKHFLVKDVKENGNATLVSYIDSVTMQVRFNDSDPVKFDSKNEGVSLPQFKKIKASIGVPLAETTFEPTGNVINLLNLQEVSKQDQETKTADSSEIEKVSASTPPARAEQADQEEDEDDVNAVGNYLVRFPEQPLKIDDRWSQSFSVPVMVDRSLQQFVRLNREYRLRSVEDGIAHLTFKTSVLSAVHNPTISSQLIQNTPSGSIDFDLERGLILKRTAELDNTEFGFSGDNSSMRAVSKTTETFVEAKIIPTAESAEQ
ncbi:hypothetical protein Pla110_20160 [Polystyrenella longa]|uniref:Uncharacterized protein n=1 Tax=Polystyrenella longa TaxID=2528007 RepID=A0A518CM31_9PLAN|nr:DUF6263 family protein [Polystyrenella longa]QDU80289.1 hypothetical protein Pla110_20160 [Polystyrenella longa]